MMLKKGKSNGRTYLSIAKGYRDKQTGVPKTKTVKSLGYLDELEKIYDDPIAHFSKIVADINEKEAEENAPVALNVDKNRRIASGENRKNLGYAVLSKLYHKLDLHRFFNNRSRAMKAEFNMNNIMKLLVFARILSPASKKKTHENREMFFENTNFTLDDVYRCLTFANTLKEALTLHLHEKVRELHNRKTDVVYYDVTNYYFEIDKPDELRKKGVSKEHRPNPIVQMGLFMDATGLPISYELFSGNTNDCSTLIPFLAKIKRTYNLGRVIVVADKGLNTGMNIAFNLIKKDGYVYSQTVRGGSKELKDYVLDEAGYLPMGDNGCMTKSRVYLREIAVVDKDGKKKNVSIKEKQVILYSRAYDIRAKAERESAITKAMSLVNNPAAYNKATSYGAAKYVKNLAFDKKTGEIITTKQRPVFDEEKLREEEKFDGYYAIATSEIKKTDEEVIEIYRGLWKIEESFRVTKSDLETRPVYLSRKDHIEAHFLICFVALLIARLVEKGLDGIYSVSRIASSLKSVSCSHLEENWYLCDYTDEIIEAVKEKFGIDLTRKYLTLGEIKKILGNTKKA